MAVEINGHIANVHQDDDTHQLTVSEDAFPLAGVESMSLQMMLMRHWVRHGKPNIIPTIPNGAVTFRYRGSDTIAIAGSPVELTRYSVSGIVWGEESVWLDRSQNLVAAVVPRGSGTLEWFQGVREGYENSLSVFLARFAQDGIEDWKEKMSKVGAIQSPIIAVIGATLIDGTGISPVTDSAVVVTNGRIVAAGPRSEIGIPPHAKVVSASGMFLVPGLWDMHAHVSQAEWGVAYLAAGVTTVRDCGGEFEVVTALRDAAGPKEL